MYLYIHVDEHYIELDIFKEEIVLVLNVLFIFVPIVHTFLLESSSGTVMRVIDCVNGKRNGPLCA